MLYAGSFVHKKDKKGRITGNVQSCDHRRRCRRNALRCICCAQRTPGSHTGKKNEKLGKKLFITGKGRCNVTNDSDTEELFPAVMSNRKFLYSAFYTYGSRDVMEFFEEAGVPLKTERGNRVFPVSDHSSDIIRALERELKKAGAQIHLHTEVKEVCTRDEKVTGVLLSDGDFLKRILW